MKRKKIIITGAYGQLGSECRKIMSAAYDVYPFSKKELDIRDMDRVNSVVGDIRPHVILNCAAYTDVDGAESNKDIAEEVNVKGVANLAKVASNYGAKIIHISTDYVFDGRKEIPKAYTEYDQPSPISVYGDTKLEGEEQVRNICHNYIILRTGWVYGLHGKNFPKTILKLSLKKDTPLKVVDDQYGSPTWAKSIALQIQVMIKNELTGIYHATSEGYCSWYEFAKFLLEAIGIKKEVIPCSSEEFKRPAKRPKNSILENYQLKFRSLNIMPFWKYAFLAFLREEGERFKNSIEFM